jgi:hypothetical protein
VRSFEHMSPPFSHPSLSLSPPSFPFLTLLPFPLPLSL